MCDRNRFTAIQSPIQPYSTQTRLPRREGFSGFGINSSTAFGMPIRRSPIGSDFRVPSIRQGDKRGFVEMGSPSPAEISFKQHFKNAYLAGGFPLRT
jgi:hypothetical protein